MLLCSKSPVENVGLALGYTFGILTINALSGQYQYPMNQFPEQRCCVCNKRTAVELRKRINHYGRWGFGKRNVQNNSDDYLSISPEEMYALISPGGHMFHLQISYPIVNHINRTINVPRDLRNTPFALTAAASDPDPSDVLTQLLGANG